MSAATAQAAYQGSKQIEEGWKADKEEKANTDLVDTYAKAQHTADTGIPPPPDAPHKSLAQHIEGFAQTLWDKFGLGDNHKPNGAAAVPSPSPPVPSSPQASASAGGTPPPAGAPSPAASAAGASSTPPAPGAVPANAPPPLLAKPTDTSAQAPNASAQLAPATPGAAPPPPDPDAASAAAKQQVQQQAAPGAASATAAAIPTGDAQKGMAMGAQAAAKAGTPPGQPEAPHSTTHLDYADLDSKMFAAAHAAAMNGKDPKAVLESLRQTQMGFIQSGMLRNLSAANNAIMSGNQPALLQAMKNVNYWLPDGKDLKTQPGPNGQLQYIDPITPKIPDPNDKSDHPKMIDNWTDVTPQHIQMLALNVQDPTKVQEAIMGVRSAQAMQALEAAKTGAVVTTANAALQRSAAQMLHAQGYIAESPVRQALWGSRANNFNALAALNLSKAVAAQAGKTGTPVAQLVQIGKQADATFEKIAAGEPHQVTAEEAAKNPVALQGSVGKTIFDSTKVPTWLQDPATGKRYDPDQLASIRSNAGAIAVANGGKVTPAQAVELAARMYQLEAAGDKVPTHMEKGTAVPNIMHGKQGTPYEGMVAIWRGDAKSGNWQRFKMNPETANSYIGGGGGAAGAIDDGMGPQNEGADSDTFNPSDKDEAQ
jgi:hypothetical protein